MVDGRTTNSASLMLSLDVASETI